MTPRPPLDTPDDTPWLAFRYVAGELSAEESSAFETRLDDDQAAREAVAEAVGLVALIRGRRVGSVPAAGPRRLRRVAIAAGAFLTLAVGTRLLPWASHPTDPQPTTTARALALTWSGLWQAGEPEPADLDDRIAWLDHRPEADPDCGLDPDLDPDGPPGWLVEAAALRGRP